MLERFAQGTPPTSRSAVRPVSAEQNSLTYLGTLRPHDHTLLGRGGERADIEKRYTDLDNLRGLPGQRIIGPTGRLKINDQYCIYKASHDDA